MTEHRKDEVLIVTSYPPVECGIATYSEDLLGFLVKRFSDSFSVRICAIEKKNTDENEQHTVVKYVLNRDSRRDYTRLSALVNNDESIKLVMIQHEFGLFGGAYGKYLNLFLRGLKKPFMITFHTVLPKPDPRRLSLVKKLSAKAVKVVVMTKHSEKILIEDYAISPTKIKHIQHGTHTIPTTDVLTLRKKYGLEGRKVISTFGLISSNKNIELTIDALPAVIHEHPETMFLIIGKTHPEVINNEGETYRNSLIKKILDADLSNHVMFINRFLELNELLEYLQVTDTYVFTSKDRNQTVSGTFAYAFSCGCPVIATSIPHAKEMINNQNGVLIDFDKPEQLSEALNRLLGDHHFRNSLKLNAVHQSRSGDWNNSALKHAHLFKTYLSDQILNYNLPPISLKHLVKMTQHIGILQFSELEHPDFNSGYTLDDNARALIAVCMDYELHRNNQNFILLDKYLRFVARCQLENGQFINYLDEAGNNHSQNYTTNLEDSNGRAIWALGTVISCQQFLPASFVVKAEMLFSFALPTISGFRSPRAIAFAIKGLYFFNLTHQSSHVRSLINKLADRLVERYFDSKSNDWLWFEDYMTYSNSILPEALLYAFLTTKKENYKTISRRTFDFLISHIFVDNQIKVISNRGWLKKGEKSLFRGGEQPIDVSYTIQSLMLFYEVFGDHYYRELMNTAFSWFLGNNHLQEIIYNPTTGGCFDGLESFNVNLNQGAESSICYLIARLCMEKIRRGEPYIRSEKSYKKSRLHNPFQEQFAFNENA